MRVVPVFGGAQRAALCRGGRLLTNDEWGVSVSGSEASCNKCSLEVDKNMNAYQVDSFQFMRCKAVTVHNKEVRCMSLYTTKKCPPARSCLFALRRARSHLAQRICSRK